MVVQIYKSPRDSKWYVRLRARNGEILSISEGYFSKWNAKRAAKKVFPDANIKYTNA